MPATQRRAARFQRRHSCAPAGRRRVPSRAVHALAALALAVVAGWAGAGMPAGESPEARARATNAAMTNAERARLLLGLLRVPAAAEAPPAEARPGAGLLLGTPRLGVPTLYETDASHGVTWINGARGNGATALPAGIAQGATWNPELIERAGAMIGGEARAKGYNVLLAGGINLMREPRNGRTFEYLGEDPLHAGLMGGAAVRGIQSNHILSTLKHFAINPQETGRHFMNVVIDEAALRESDLLAFEIAIEQSDAGALMCAYNALNGPLSCGSRFLLTEVLRDDWGYKGFVMSDWGAVESLDFALAGLDQQSGAALDEGLFFGAPLLEAAAGDPAWQARLEEMATRVLYSIYAQRLDRSPVGVGAVDRDANEAIALATAHEGIVLLANRDGALPLAKSIASIAVIGGYADAGTLVGGGSSRVHDDAGPSVSVPLLPGLEPEFTSFTSEQYNRAAPLAAIRAAAPGAAISFADGRYVSEAAAHAARADVAIVFATQYQTEGYDVPDLSLPRGQDGLIAAVAEANPNTIVVLQTGGPVLMPWLDAVAAVLEAWYPGARGGQAIADVLFGVVNPSGHLPVSFPASLDDLPRPRLDGLDTVPPGFVGKGLPGQVLDVDYNVEGSDVGYRWFAREGLTPLLPFGHGLSYTSFEHGELGISGDGAELRARFTLKNTGTRTGADVVQLYLTAVNGRRRQRLAGFAKRELAPGATATVSLRIDPRLISDWRNGRWEVAPGRYAFALGQDATHLAEPVTIRIEGFAIAADGRSSGPLR